MYNAIFLLRNEQIVYIALILGFPFYVIPIVNWWPLRYTSNYTVRKTSDNIKKIHACDMYSINTSLLFPRHTDYLFEQRIDCNGTKLCIVVLFFDLSGSRCIYAQTVYFHGKDNKQRLQRDVLMQPSNEPPLFLTERTHFAFRSLIAPFG